MDMIKQKNIANPASSKSTFDINIFKKLFDRVPDSAYANDSYVLENVKECFNTNFTDNLLHVKYCGGYDFEDKNNNIIRFTNWWSGANLLFEKNKCYIIKANDIRPYIDSIVRLVCKDVLYCTTDKIRIKLDDYP